MSPTESTSAETTEWYAIPDGSDEDIRRAYLNNRMTTYLAEAEAHRLQAKELLSTDLPAAEIEARAALDRLVRAFWWAEERPEEEPIHKLMHEVGRWTRETFGCDITPTDRGYEQRCPVSIAHKRMGLSIGFTARRICSLCGGDLSECPDMPGIAYLVPGGIGPAGACPVCLSATCHEHDPKTAYRVSVILQIMEGIIEEVSFVRRPAQPEARLTALPLSTSGLQELFGPDFKPGMPISCDQCLTSCAGFASFDTLL